VVKRVHDLHALLALSRPGELILDTDSIVGQHRRLDVVDEPVEGIPAVRSVDGMAMPLMRCHIDGEGSGLEDLMRLGQLVATQQQVRLELVRFTFRHHIQWIEP